MTAEFLMQLDVSLAPPKIVGSVPEGELCIIPIVGGAFAGPKLRGKVCPGGADWNTRLPGGLAHAHAKYWIETQDGWVIGIENEGVFAQTAPPDGIKTVPRFQVSAESPYAFLLHGVYAGEIRSGDTPDQVKIIFYSITAP